MGFGLGGIISFTPLLGLDAYDFAGFFRASRHFVKTFDRTLISNGLEFPQ